MIKLIDEVIGAFGEIIAWLFGIKKKQPTQNKDAVRKPDRIPQKIEPLAQIKNIALNPEYDIWKVKVLAPQPATKTTPNPSIEIEPKAFYHWAGNDLVRWKLLIGAAIRHTYYGNGFIKKVNRADEHSSIIHLSIAMNNDQRNMIFVASNFNNSDKPFYGLLVDSDCKERFQKEKIPGSPRDMSQWRHDWNEYEEVINHYQIEFLYHFTDSANIPSIIQHGGLYSWWSCQSNGILIPKPGGDELSRKLDHGKKMQDYVRLSLNQNSPMLKQAVHEGRIEKPFFLKISPEVIYLKPTLFSNLNAAATDAQIGNGLEDFKRIRFEIATQPNYSVDTKLFYQAEVLVRTHIPIKYIFNIN